MIISASRRTDIPTYYSEWFFNRIREKYVLVRNPMNTHQISCIDLSPDLVDCIVFWTKNPAPMISQLEKIKDYSYYFQFTLNSYGKEVEENIPSKNKVVIESFKRLSDKIGPEKVIWRYDPIFINSKYSIAYHAQYFERLAFCLKDHTEKCTISFLDDYPKTKNNMKSLNTKEMDRKQKKELAEIISHIALQYGLKVDTCAESIELDDLGINHAKCIDDELIERIMKHPLSVEKDKNQRLECGCIASIDIGTYHTCMNGCKYCYANHSPQVVKDNFSKYDSSSPLLCSSLDENDTVSERTVKSLKEDQLKLF